MKSKEAVHTAIEMHGHSAAPAAPSDRRFGLVFAAFFVAVGLYPLLGGSPVRGWSLGIGALFGLAATFAPRRLAPLNRLWAKLGTALGRVTSPIALFLVYAFAIVPTALVLRALGKDPLRLRWDRNAASYWIPRTPPGRADEQMKRQF